MAKLTSILAECQVNTFYLSSVKTNTSESEAIPVILPKQTPDSSITPVTKTFSSKFTLPIVFVVLLLIAAGVFFLLPTIIQQPHGNKIATAEPVAESKVPIKQSVSDTSLVHYTNPQQVISNTRSQAEQSLALFLRKKTELEAQNVAKWAQEDYRVILARADEANTLIKQQQYKASYPIHLEAIASLETLSDSKLERLKQSLTLGIAAIENQNGEEAQRQFNLALAIDPSNITAKQGTIRAQTVEKVVILLQEGAKLEKDDLLDNAKTEYKQALSLDSESSRANEAIRRIDEKIAAKKFRLTMNDGFSNLEKRKFSAAHKAFLAALTVKPDSQAAIDALAQADEGYQFTKITAHKRQAEQLEKQEQWEQASEQYQAALKLDSSLQFAQTGRKRSKNLSNLHQELDYNLSHPDRLSSKEPATKAKLLLGKLKNLESKGAELARKTAALKELLRQSQIGMPVQLQSDGKTDVVIYKVGKFGKFLNRKLELRPGTYTAVGTCPGYRDVRRQFTVTARGRADIEIHCEERI
ncbi:MAG: hypothetical protein V3V31_09795 [Methylococcales bacterium]